MSSLAQRGDELRSLIYEIEQDGMVVVANEIDGQVDLMIGYRHPDGPEDADVFITDVTP